MTRTVVIGVSTRALAESAARVAPDMVAVDFFGDRDQARAVESHAVGRDLGLPLTAAGLAEGARRVGAQAVVYGANLENHPEVVADLAGSVEVLGNDAGVLSRVRDWRSLRGFCDAAGIAHPETLFAGEEGRARRGGRWLRKRVRSGGGHGVRGWTGGALDEGHLLQREITGRPASVAFAADGADCRVIGFCEQLAGRRWLGASGFTWCGNLLPFPAPPREYRDLLAQVTRVARELTRRYGLRGLNGADLVVAQDDSGRPRAVLIEVNPRYSASMELAERAYGLSAYALHLDALVGRLPPVAAAAEPPSEYHGKAIVYAGQDLVVPDTCDWYGLGRRDIPYRGEHIAAGHPVCTVLGAGVTRSSCLERLSAGAKAVYEETRPRREGRRASADGSPGSLARRGYRGRGLWLKECPWTSA